MLDSYFGPYYKNLRSDFTKYTLSENVTSIKKFYTAMYKHGYISDEDFDELISTIRIQKHEWLEEIEEETYYYV